MRVRFAGLAEKDVKKILRDTRKKFGPGQVKAYSAIIDRATAMLADNPDRPSSLDRSDLFPHVRSFHLSLAAGKRGAAAHKIFYTVQTARNNVQELVILRVLHDAMEPKRRMIGDFKPVGFN